MQNFLMFVDQMISATAWPMTPPRAYGPFHLLFCAIGLALSLLLAWKLRGLDDRGNRALLQGVGIFLAVCEVYKQLFYYFYIGDNAYQWWIFPFQLCSIPMYLCLLSPVLRKGPVQRGMYNFLLFYNLLGGFVAFLEPSGLIHEYWTLTLHAFVWHMTLVFVGLYLGFSGRAGTRREDYRQATATFLVLCVVAFCINLLFWDASQGSINMFFVGPKNSPLIVFKDIAARCGWAVSTLLYIPTVCLGGYLVYLPARLLGKRGSKGNKTLQGVGR